MRRVVTGGDPTAMTCNVQGSPAPTVRRVPPLGYESGPFPAACHRESRMLCLVTCKVSPSPATGGASTNGLINLQGPSLSAALLQVGCYEERLDGGGRRGHADRAELLVFHSASESAVESELQPITEVIPTCLGRHVSERGLWQQRGGELAGLAECRHETRDLQLVRASAAPTPRGRVSIVPQQTLKPHIHCRPARVNGFNAPACCCC
ncbi:hypothetical protein E2C01_049231 [Portunus trituberculatus]|uniref:Uncharacterized protein n=1 Tax=Portunus trituberculatus TaxID=210409 RepID=A0A5B7GCB3_PORTR|nr:hypothetical protein [Portunus trituberculatus]